MRSSFIESKEEARARDEDEGDADEVFGGSEEHPAAASGLVTPELRTSMGLSPDSRGSRRSSSVLTGADSTSEIVVVIPPLEAEDDAEAESQR